MMPGNAGSSDGGGSSWLVWWSTAGTREEPVSESKPDGKPFEISKRLIWEAWLRVKANKGAEGVDEESIEEFEGDLKGNLYKLWNRMSSGSYMPPPVRAVEIPKKGGHGVRTLGVPTVADRVAPPVHGRARRVVRALASGRSSRQWSRWHRPGAPGPHAIGQHRRRTP
jgi:hypothetical protein